MKNLKTITGIVLLAISGLVSTNSTYLKSDNKTNHKQNISNLKFFKFEISSIEEPLQLIEYTHHTIILNKGLKLPIYESHTNYKKELSIRKNYQRPPFIQDLRFKQWTYPTSTYNGTGFDRGHLYSAESASVNSKGYMECFLMTNIIPQNPQLNRGEWKRLEELARNEAMKFDSIKEINLLYKFEQNTKFMVPRYCSKLLIYPDSSIKFWTFDNFKNIEIKIQLDSIQIMWNTQNRVQFKK